MDSQPQPALQAILLLVLLGASAFFSSAETALTTVNRIQVQLLADEESRREIGRAHV